MELLCCGLLFVVGLVSATPYGYSTKGGAIAKADASAVSGAFSAPAPLLFSIPSGTGYSGSFSKSSSSSFASSSASSSSSSGSFSFSGTGGGLSTNNQNGALGTGCNSGSCQSVGGQGVAGNIDSSGSGANLQGYAVPSAAGATSNSIATGNVFIAGNIGSQAPCNGNTCSNQETGCKGANCNDIEIKNNKCSSGKCEHEFPGIPLSGQNTGCVSGACGSDTSKSKDGANTNNIPVKVSGGSDSIFYNEQHQNKNYNHGLDNSGNDCSKGHCGGGTTSNIKPVTELNSGDSYQIPSIQQSSHGAKCDSPDCNSGTLDLPTGHNAFVSELQEPGRDLSPPSLSCTTPNCQSDYSQSTPRNPSIGLPENPLCSSGKCGTTIESTHGTASDLGSSSVCASGNCGGGLPNQDLPNSKYPAKNVPPVNPVTTCNTPNCAPIVTSLGNNINTQVQQEGISYTGSGASHSFNNIPSFTSPKYQPRQPTNILGCNTPNCSPQYSSNTPEHISSNVGCNTPDCVSKPSNLGTNINNQVQSELSQTGHTTSHTSNNIPNYTSNGLGSAPIGTISGCTTPNCESNLSTFGKPSSCNTPDCASNQFALPIGEYVNQSNCKTANCAANIPNKDSSKEKVPPYTGGFGGPSGILKPNELSPSSIVFPSTQNVHSNNNVPTYTGGFGAPAGLLQPVGHVSALSPVNKQQQQPSYSSFDNPAITFQPQAPATHNLNSGGVHFATGSGTYQNTKPIDTLKPLNDKIPSQTSEFGVPAGINTEYRNTINSKNSANSGAASHDSQTSNTVDTNKYFAGSAYQASGQFSAPSKVPLHTSVVKPTNEDIGEKDLPPYTGGFDAPAGLLKPNDYSTPSSNNKKVTSNGQNQLCSSGNCGDHPDLTGHIQGHTSSSQNVHSQSFATAEAEAKAAAYTGGFGGPQGLLKPYDDGKLSGSLLGGKVFAGAADTEINNSHSKVDSGSLVNINKQQTASFGAQTGAANQAGSVGGAFTGGHSGLYGGYKTGNGDDIKVGGCGGECRESGSLGVAQSAATAAQASSVAQASATAGAFASGYGFDNTQQGGSDYDAKAGGGGCGQGCSGTSHPGGNQFGYSGTGYNNGLNVANAQSVAGARALGGIRGSYASSSATAQASSGFPTKGGYGKR